MPDEMFEKLTNELAQATAQRKENGDNSKLKTVLFGLIEYYKEHYPAERIRDIKEFDLFTRIKEGRV